MMVGRKLFKTKLCVLYQKGHCSRPSCSFAHGNAELRRFAAASIGRTEYRGNDLRHKLDSRHSPQQERDSRGRHVPREYSSSWSLERHSDRKRRKKEHGDACRDYSGNLRISDRNEEHDRQGKISSVSRDTLEGQLNKMQTDIEMAEQRKHQAEVYLDEKIQEVDSLASRVQELESQLYNERQECRRIKSKIKKFVKAHNRHSRLQDELNRSQVRLQQLGDQLGSDVNKIGANEEDSSINIVSDGDEPGYHASDPFHGLQRDTSASKRKMHAVQDIAENSKRANESRQRRGRTSSSVSSADKVRGLDSGVAVPLTSMAGHAVDEEVDIDLEINHEEKEPRESSMEAASGSLPFLPPPPPPPIREFSHSKIESKFYLEHEKV
ncbi:zinc finger CCCH domain-containing protein 13 isoform X7 [Cucumis melo]|uniref:Zinc finger CCCH domain-containing protein 13 isoform X7 n=1 Tax=Cucumis melo TaxID=3656 RepID=A0ABM3KSR4_CUCME|nr:zinc finger CCCH domain-containing protein 13 isoform X7 [Cucumis melo]